MAAQCVYQVVRYAEVAINKTVLIFFDGFDTIVLTYADNPNS